MNDLYVDSLTHRPYSQNGMYAYPFEQGQIVQIASLSEKGTPQTAPTLQLMDANYIFLETYFEPISRIKRGKFFTRADGGQPKTVCWSPSRSDVLWLTNGSQAAHAFHFLPYQPSRDFNLRLTFAYFGNGRLTTRWRILSADPVLSGEEIYVLQETSGIGSIPAIDRTKLPTGHADEIESEYSSLLAELHGSPETIIEHCRDVAVSLLSAFFNVSKEKREDLGELIKRFEANKQVVARASAEVINRFHPRRKPNEKEKLDLPALTHQDADFAVQAVFQIVRELKFQRD